MERKLIKQGGGGYTIYLPKKWVDEMKLKAGNLINIEQAENELVISPRKIKTKTSTEVKVTGLTESSIRTILTNTYRLGYDKVTVSFEKEKQFKIINNVVKTRLLGFEIIKKEQNNCIIENITEPSSDQFNVLLQKILYNITELIKITEQRLTNKAPIEDYEETEARIQQYDNFCRRVIAKKQITEKNAQLYWAFLTLIIHAQREVYHINRFLDKNKVKISKSTLNFLKDGNNLFELLKKAYLKKDIKLLEEIHDKEKELTYKKAYNLLSTIKGKENIIIGHLTIAARNIYLANSPLMGLFL
ncbi:AbrB/MazE/SpoVT family DNA-binding domain-containing protein [Nanoarchaeota archaeon]